MLHFNRTPPHRHSTSIRSLQLLDTTFHLPSAPPTTLSEPSRQLSSLPLPQQLSLHPISQNSLSQHNLRLELGSVLGGRGHQILKGHGASSRGVAPLQQDADPTVVQDSGDHHRDVEDLVAVEEQVERARVPALWDTAGVQSSSSLQRTAQFTQSVATWQRKNLHLSRRAEKENDSDHHTLPGAGVELSKLLGTDEQSGSCGTGCGHNLGGPDVW